MEGTLKSGKKFASGYSPGATYGSKQGAYTVTVPMNLDFTPSFVFVTGTMSFYQYGDGTNTFKGVASNLDTVTGNSMPIVINNVSAQSFNITVRRSDDGVGNRYSSTSISEGTWYAFE